jgi:hypothetical protein
MAAPGACDPVARTSAGADDGRGGPSARSVSTITCGRHASLAQAFSPCSWSAGLSVLGRYGARVPALLAWQGKSANEVSSLCEHRLGLPVDAAARASSAALDGHGWCSRSLAFLDREPETYPRAAAKWASRFAIERWLTLTDAQLTLAALAALPGQSARAGVEALIELADRYKLRRVGELLTGWIDGTSRHRGENVRIASRSHENCPLASLQDFPQRSGARLFRRRTPVVHQVRLPASRDSLAASVGVSRDRQGDTPEQRPAPANGGKTASAVPKSSL